ncbi:DUF2007 domain-containing protein [Candidatus Fermentibacteria bacterium]|nr:DUF2007 domain-containing protein [Candidatus Fermentibacteria bacterium]
MRTVVVHRCHDDIEAAQIGDMLTQEGIPCQVASSVPHTVLPLTTDGLGEVRISVREDHTMRARELIELFLAEGMPMEDEQAHDHQPS